MSSSLGQIALGVVGAVIGAPFGLSAVGFSVGSAIGGSIFAPDGPNQEGPRLGDTAVAASSLGKIIAEHWGVTRTAGNVIWSAGLKEVKRVEEISGGGGKGGGGGGGTSTTYEYYASFAASLGKGPAVEVRKIWADGKLIFDGPGETDTDNSKYIWRLLKGGPNEGIDPLIRDSVNRRLAGLPDVNEGNQEQAVYTKLEDIISESAASDDARTQLYATNLAAIKAAAETDLAEGEVPDYGFTPAYRGLAVLVFDDMALADFGNRIPNITAEVVWAGAADGNGQDQDAPEPVPIGVRVTEIASTAVPDGLMATDNTNRRAFAHIDGVVRRFVADGKKEDRQVELSPDLAPYDEWEGVDVYEEDHNRERRVYYPLPHQHGHTIDRLVTALPSGNVLAFGSYTTYNKDTYWAGTEIGWFILSGDTLQPLGRQMTTDWTDETIFAATIPLSGAYPPYIKVHDTGADHGSTKSVPTNGATGDHFVYSAGQYVQCYRVLGGEFTDVTSIQTPTVAYSGGPALNVGPIATGAAEPSWGYFYPTKYHSSSGVWIGRCYLRNDAINNGYAEYGALTAGTESFVWLETPFSYDIDHISAIVFNPGTETLLLVASLAGGHTGMIYLTDDLEEIWKVEVEGVTPPGPNSGLSRSDMSNNTFAFADGQTLVEVNIVNGEYEVYEDILSANADSDCQAYFATVRGLLIWEGGVPYIYDVGQVNGKTRDHYIAALLPDVIRDICRRAGMEWDEFSVADVAEVPMRGYSLARATSGRQALEYLMQAFFVDGVESDWKLRFFDRNTDSLRTIKEKELGVISGPTGDVNWLEVRTPEYDIPSEINVNFADPLRDYQTNTAHKRRISNPIPSMYSHTVENIELPMVMKEHEAKDTAERMLFLSWMSRDAAKTKLSWAHADLDPGDVISVEFEDGRTVTDRVTSATLGANFEIETQTVRSGDPVYEPAPSVIIPTGSIPTVSKGRPVDSEMFVFDIPLLRDFHETGRAAPRYYTAVGSQSERWSSATVFRSTDGNTYSSESSVLSETTWGSVIGQLGAPRALWTTDTDNKLRISVGKDRGDLVSVTREEILDGANMGLVYNRETGVGEIIQFQDVNIINDGATIVLKNLNRGLRGTDYAVDQHGPGEVFILLKDTDYQVKAAELGRVGSSDYFKAVSAGQVISSVPPRTRQYVGRSLMPYAPNKVRRSTTAANDLTITWNRRTRIGGEWDMATPLETVALNEDFEQYELYLIPPGLNALNAFDPADTGSYYFTVTVNEPTHTFAAQVLTNHGVDITGPVNVAVYQISAQVGRGFPALGSLAP